MEMDEPEPRTEDPASGELKVVDAADAVDAVAEEDPYSSEGACWACFCEFPGRCQEHRDSEANDDVGHESASDSFENGSEANDDVGSSISTGASCARNDFQGEQPERTVNIPGFYVSIGNRPPSGTFAAAKGPSASSCSSASASDIHAAVAISASVARIVMASFENDNVRSLALKFD